MSTFLLDLRHAFKSLLRTPGFTLAATLILALGIGANTAIFSVINAVLLRPLPYEQPDRLVVLRENKLPQLPEFSVSVGNFLDWQKQSTDFEQLAASDTPSFTLTGRGDPESLRGGRTTANLFQTLGVQPILGRTFLPQEEEPGRDGVVMLSHGLWQSRFGGSPTVLDTTLTLNGRSYTIVGVMPRGFSFPEPDLALWTPLAFSAEQRVEHDNHFLRVIGRLKRGVSVAQAHSEMRAIALRLGQQFPDTNAGWSVRIWPLLEYMVEDIKPALLLLLGAVILVLLMACANTANLLLARAAVRSKEIAIRSAMGASRWQVVRQMLTESLVLTTFGAALGLLLAWAGLRVLLGIVPTGIPRLQEVRIDGTVLAFTLGVALITCLLFGLFPALQTSRPNLNETLRDTDRGSSGGRGSRRTRAALVVTEVALALILLIGANLMLTSFLHLRAVPPGFDTKNVLTMVLSLPRTKYEEGQKRVAFTHELVQKAQGLPGVNCAAVAMPLPLVGDRVQEFMIEGRPLEKRNEWPSTNDYSVSPEFFRAMGIPLLQGRVFAESDRDGAPPVTIVNQSLARRFFSNVDPIGKRIQLGNDPDGTFREIVGVVGDTKQDSLASDTPLQVYEPFAQMPNTRFIVVVRAKEDPKGLTGALRAQVASIDKDLAVSNIRTLDQVVNESVTGERFAMAMLSIFSGLALVLASLGIYGVVSFLVAQRRREFGIRMALGADGKQVAWEVTRQSLVLTAIGLGLGVIGTLASGSILASQLFGVKPADPLAMAEGSLALTVVALAASLIPALRAARVDPMVALREE